MKPTTTSDEKIMAALVHGSVIMAFIGPIVPVIIWASQRKKSKYVSFHALQAMGYQALIFWLWIVATILIAVLAFLLVFPLSISLMKDSRNAAFFPFLLQIFIFGSIFGLILLFLLPGIIGAIACLIDRDFGYPILGKWLERYLSYEAGSDSEIDEEHEDSWVAGICHATTILRFWGVVTPLIVWFTQKERSVRLRFQSMQAFIYQAIGLVMYILGMAFYMLFFFGMFFALILGGTMGISKEIQGPAAVIMLVSFGVMMLFWLVFMIVLPIYYLLAGFASIRVMQGRNFHYPIIGTILEKRMERLPTRSESHG